MIPYIDKVPGALFSDHNLCLLSLPEEDQMINTKKSQEYHHLVGIPNFANCAFQEMIRNDTSGLL
jgi:hypothetical protein